MITKDQIEKSFKDRKKYDSYKYTVDQLDHMAFHMDGHKRFDGNALKMNPYYAHLITERRPRESEKVQKYREAIYKNITKSSTKKVVNAIQKLFKASDWKISYNKSETPNSIATDEQMEVYCEKEFPKFGSVTNWAATYMLRNMLKDANALVVVMPDEFDIPDNEYLEPCIYIIPSDQVYQYKEGKYALYCSEEKTMYRDGGEEYEGDVYYLWTKESFIKIYQTSLKRDYKMKVIAEYDEMPVWRIGGEIVGMKDNTMVFESFISGMLPYLDEAAREYSDLQASVVQHLYPTMWYMEGQTCQPCNGTGTIIREGKDFTCSSCNGAGTMPHSPYKDIVVKKPKFDDQQPITPPGGEISKSTAITELQDERIVNHLYAALSSLNMEFLSRVDANQSGVAKEFDREELNTFIFGIARHIVENILKPSYYYIAWWRYKGILNEVDVVLPWIAVPEKYDIITDRMLIAELEKSETAKIDPIIRNEMEIDYTTKRFRTDEKSKSLILISKRHDPFPGLDKKDLNDLLLSGAIEKVDMIMSLYLPSFITEEVADNQDFLYMSYTEQNAILRQKAINKAQGVTTE